MSRFFGARTLYRVVYSSLCALVLLGSMLSSCAGTPDMPGTGGTQYARVREKLVEGARWAKGRTSLKVRGRTFRLDCTGTIMAVYPYSGIDLAVRFNEYTGNGVSRIYHYLLDEGLIYATDYPQPGDIIFWDDSYDKNGDGVANDTLTHMGMVVETEDSGDITYIHYNYRKGIVFAEMNLEEPNNIDRNSPMRMRSLEPVNGSLWLSSHLYKEAGKGYLLYRLQ